MQSISSLIQPSLARISSRQLLGKYTTKIEVSNLSCRSSSWISNRGGLRAKPIRRFSEGNSIAGGSSSGHNQGSSRFSFFEWYSKKLDTHPVTTKCISAGLISSLGNVLAQAITHREEQNKQASDPNNQHQLEPKPFEVNVAQVSRFVLLNVAFVAPVFHHWYQFINRAVPGKSMSRVLQRTFWDEFVFSPMYIPVFLGMLWKLEGKTNDHIVTMLKSECPSIIVAEWAIWVPTMIVTFRYAPVKFQVLVINVVGVVWQTYLAYASSNAHSSSPKLEDKEGVSEQEAGADNVIIKARDETDSSEIAAGDKIR